MGIIIFGMGIVANIYLKTFPDLEDKLIGFLESSKGDKDEYRGKKVYQLSDIKDIEFDEIHIANSHYETVEQVIKQGVHPSKIVLCYIGLLKECIKRNGDICFRYSLPAVLTSKFFHENVFGDEVFDVGNNRFILNDDYCRAGTLQLLTEEIKERNIEGELAELGVYRGDFAKYLNQAFPNRKLFLFDTFEGFAPEQERENIELGYSTSHDIANTLLKDTSVQIVMEKMKNPEQVVICKGLFPATAPQNGEHISFAFVSLDCDLYTPILDGLRYFYPKLSKGGYIMIHDYNNEKFSAGVRKAVNEYEKEYGDYIPKVPLPDEEGTLVITK